MNNSAQRCDNSDKAHSWECTAAGLGEIMLSSLTAPSRHNLFQYNINLGSFFDSPVAWINNSGPAVHERKQYCSHTQEDMLY